MGYQDEVNPNEIIFVYASSSSVLNALLGSTNELSEIVDKIADGDSEDSPPALQFYRYDLRDGNGQPLVFPLQVVSETIIAQTLEEGSSAEDGLIFRFAGNRQMIIRPAD